MEKINSTSKVEFQVTLTLNEKEVKALNAITVYGTKEFLEIFYRHLGKTYLAPYEDGLESLFKTIETELPKHIKKIDDTKNLWK